MLQKKIQNVAYLDVLRIIATFGVITLHVCANGFNRYHYTSFDWCVSAIGDSLVRWAVPIFVMISGTLFLNPNKEITVKEIFYKRIPRLLSAYVFWTIFYSLVVICRDIVSNGGEYTFKLGHFVPFYHLWFLPMLMGVYVFIPFIKKIVTDEKLMKYGLIVWLCYIFGNFVLRIDIPQISFLFKMNAIVGYAGYFMLGYYVSIHKITHKQRKIIYLLGILGGIITIAGIIGLSIFKGKADTTFFENCSIHVIMMALALFVFVKENSKVFESKISGFIKYVKKNLFGIYLVHAFWLPVVNNKIFRDATNDLIAIPIIVIVVFILSLYTTKLIRLIPFLKKVVE